MGIVFSSIAYTLRSKLVRRLPLGHVHEVLAAALGYKSYAAFKASPEEAPSFDDVQHVVLDRELLKQRLSQLGYSGPADHDLVARAIAQSFKERLPKVCVHDGVSDLMGDIYTAVARDIEDSGAYSSEVAMTNAYDGDFDLDVDEASPFEVHEPVWILSVSGTSSLEQDPDNVYHGDVIDVSATVVFAKLGRRVLGEFEVQDVGASIRSEPPEIDPEDALSFEP